MEAEGPARRRPRWWLLAVLAAGTGVVARLRSRRVDETLPAPEPAGSPSAIDLDAETSDVVSLDVVSLDVVSLMDAAGPSAEQLDVGRGVLGTSLALDDLEAVEGIGPAIARLLHEQGVTTWRALSTIPVATLREMLDGAGSRFRVHDPATWPEQAGLLADGDWAAFRTLTEQLVGGRAAAPPATPAP